MSRMVTATVTGKTQITIPKPVRETLKIRTKGDLVGFIIDDKNHSVKLTKVTLVPIGEEFTEKDLKKLLALAKERGGKTFKSAAAAIRYHKKLVRR